VRAFRPTNTTCPYTDLRPELENTGTRIDSDFTPEHADLIQGQRKKQKRLERRIKRGIVMLLGWAMNAAMIYLILVTARTTPDIWDPYEVLGVSKVWLLPTSFCPE
jgi:translocation protein SEC63